MFSSDGKRSCSVLFPPTGKQIVIPHARSSKHFLENSFLLCGKKLSESYADYHTDMSGTLFEDWFNSKITQRKESSGRNG